MKFIRLVRSYYAKKWLYIDILLRYEKAAGMGRHKITKEKTFLMEDSVKIYNFCLEQEINLSFFCYYL